MTDVMILSGRTLRLSATMLVLAVMAGCASGGGNGEASSDDGANAVEESVRMGTADLHKSDGSPTQPALDEATPIPERDADPLEGMYRLGAGDVLLFKSFDDPTLDQAVIVRYDGYVSLPMVPDISVENLTRAEATQLVFDAYSEIFADPQISLSITESRSKFYTVIGEVERPATYPYDRPLTVLDAITQAGGQRVDRRSGDSFIGQQGSLSKALIIRRRDDGSRDVYQYNLRNLSDPGVHDADAPVFPGDIVYVPEGVNLVYLIGEVPRPNVYRLGEDTTLVQLLAQAGGINFQTGKLRRIVLMRETDSDYTDVLLIDLEKILRTGQDLQLQPGDVIYVPRKDLVRLQQFVQRFTGSISPLISLYTQALRGYYDKDFIDQSLDSGTGGNDINSIINTIQNLTPNLSGFIN